MNTRIMYLRDNNNPQGKGNPIGCLAIDVLKGTDNRTVINYQVSVLHPTDVFDRKLGQIKATGKLGGNPICADVISETDISIHQVSSIVMNHLLNNKQMPARARRSAKRWLADAKNLDV